MVGEQIGEMLVEWHARMGDFDGAVALVSRFDGFGVGRSTGLIFAMRDGRNAAARARARGLDPGLDGFAFEEMARVQAESGDLASARATAGMMKNVFAFSAWASIARASGDKADLARMMAFKDAKEEAHQEDVAWAQAACGDVAGAKRTAAAVKTESYRSAAIMRIAQAQARRGDLAGAMGTARGLDDVFHEDQAYVRIAAAAALKGDVAAASAAVERVRSLLTQPRAKAVLAYAQARAGDRAGAAKTVATVSKDLELIAYATGMVVAAEIANGDLAEARRVLAEGMAVVETPPYRSPPKKNAPPRTEQQERRHAREEKETVRIQRFSRSIVLFEAAFEGPARADGVGYMTR